MLLRKICNPRSLNKEKQRKDDSVLKFTPWRCILCLIKHHATETYGGVEGITPCTLDLIRAAITRGKNFNTHSIGGWVVPRAGLNAVEKRKIPCTYPERTPTVQPPMLILLNT